MALSTSQVRCPALVCTCGGSEVVTATYRETTVEVAPCAPLKAQGWGKGPAVVLWHSQAVEMLAPVVTTVSHVDGLVVFA